MNVRPITDDDIDSIARLVAEDEGALFGRPSRLGPNDVRGWLTRANLEDDSWLYEDDGQLVALSWFEHYDDLGIFIGVVGLRPDAARAFYETLDAAFQDHWEHHSVGFERWWEEKQSVPDFDPTLWFLVRDGDDVAAVIRNDPHGVRRVTLGVDAESPTGATKLYESVGMTVENAAVVYEKALA